MSFYKLDPEQGVLLAGPNYVLNQDYELRRELKDTYQYPVAGWYWFDTEHEARSFFNLPKDNSDA